MDFDVSLYPDTRILLSVMLPWCAVNSEQLRVGGSSKMMLVKVTSLLIIKIPSSSSPSSFVSVTSQTDFVMGDDKSLGAIVRDVLNTTGWISCVWFPWRRMICLTCVFVECVKAE